MTIDEACRLLGVRTNASPVELKRAYRDLALVWHPDRFAGSPHLIERANGQMREINAAFALLSLVDVDPLRSNQSSSEADEEQSAGAARRHAKPADRPIEPTMNVAIRKRSAWGRLYVTGIVLSILWALGVTVVVSIEAFDEDEAADRAERTVSQADLSNYYANTLGRPVRVVPSQTRDAEQLGWQRMSDEQVRQEFRNTARMGRRDARFVLILGAVIGLGPLLVLVVLRSWWRWLRGVPPDSDESSSTVPAAPR